MSDLSPVQVHRLSSFYLSLVLSFSLFVLGLSKAYLGYIMGISWVYHGHILGISWAYLWHSLSASRVSIFGIFIVFSYFFSVFVFVFLSLCIFVLALLNSFLIHLSSLEFTWKPSQSVLLSFRIFVF